MARDFSPNWAFPEPKAKVAAALERTLAELQKDAAQQPENEELALLTGIVASEANNLLMRRGHSMPPRLRSGTPPHSLAMIRARSPRSAIFSAQAWISKRVWRP